MTERRLLVGAIGVLLVSHVCMYRVLANIRSDQLTIRHWIAHEMRARRTVDPGWGSES